MLDPGDAILFAISALRSMRWQIVNKMFDHFQTNQAVSYRLGLEDESQYERRSAAMLLDALAHCDIDFRPAGGRVVIAPPILASLPTGGLPRAVFCGSRSPGMLAKVRSISLELKHNVRLQPMSQRNLHLYAPSRLELEADSEEYLQMFANGMNLPYVSVPPSWTIGYLCGSLNEYTDSLHWSTEPELNWLRHDFDMSQLQFTGPQDTPSPLRLSRYRDPVRSIWKYMLRRGQESAEVDVSWGRYAVLHSVKKLVINYDPRTNNVMVPRNVPLPRLLTRALVLCSGFIPKSLVYPGRPNERKRPQEFYQFQGVPSDFFDFVASKVGQTKSAYPT